MGPITKRLTGKKLTGVLEVIDNIAKICYIAKPEKDAEQQLLKTLLRIVSFDAATLYQLNQQKDKLEKAAILGDNVEVLSFLELEQGGGLSGWTAHSKKPLLLSDRSCNQDYNPDHDYASFMSVPLVIADEIIGVINLGSKKPNAFNKDDVEVMSLVSVQVALSLKLLSYQKECIAFEKDLKEKKKSLNNLKRNIINPNATDNIARLSTSVIHKINNALTIIIGNIQCILVEKAVINQKMLGRIKRIESAAFKISELNENILNIHKMVQNQIKDNEHRDSDTKKVISENV